MLTASPLYLALCALIYVFLTMYVVRQRVAARTTLGDGGDKELRKRIRAHGNFAEFVPLMLILLVVCELQGAPAFAIHILGLLIVASRLGHAFFLTRTPEVIATRQLTMGSTLLLIIVMALGLLGHAIF